MIWCHVQTHSLWQCVQPLLVLSWMTCTDMTTCILYIYQSHSVRQESNPILWGTSISSPFPFTRSHLTMTSFYYKAVFSEVLTLFYLRLLEVMLRCHYSSRGGYSRNDSLCASKGFLARILVTLHCFPPAKRICVPYVPELDPCCWYFTRRTCVPYVREANVIVALRGGSLSNLCHLSLCPWDVVPRDALLVRLLFSLMT